MSGYVYPGNKADFYAEYGGLPDNGIKLSTIFLITLIIVIIIIGITAVFFLRQKPETVTINHTGFYNLDTLRDINDPGTTCCVYPGTTAPNESYVYRASENITYSRQKPTNINTVCNSFPNPLQCISDNTDSAGNIIPKVVYKAEPYFVFENDLFIGCATTTTCPLA